MAGETLSPQDIEDLIQKHSRSRIFHFEFEGTLNDLKTQEDGLKGWVSEPFITEESAQYRFFGSDVASERIGDLSKADVHSINIQSFANTFGTAVTINLFDPSKNHNEQIIRGCHRIPARSIETKSDPFIPSRRALYVIPAGHTDVLEFPPDIYFPRPQAYSLGNIFLGDKSVDMLDEEKSKYMKTTFGDQVISYMIDPEIHQIANLIDRVLDPAETIVSEAVDTIRQGVSKAENGMISVSVDAFNAMNDLWKRNHSEQVTKVNLSNIRVALSPTGRTWKDYTDAIEDAYGASGRTRVTTPGRIAVSFKITYTLGGHGVHIQKDE